MVRWTRQTLPSAIQGLTFGQDRNVNAYLPVAAGSGVARHFVYILTCSDGSLYTGYTTDPARRLAEHNHGKGSRYTRSRRPVSLAYLEELRSRALALSREIRIKSMPRSGKLLLCRTYAKGKEPSSR